MAGSRIVRLWKPLGWLLLVLAALETLDWIFAPRGFFEVPRDSLNIVLEFFCPGNGYFAFCFPFAAAYQTLFIAAIVVAFIVSICRLARPRRSTTAGKFGSAEVLLVALLSVVNLVCFLWLWGATTINEGPLHTLFIYDSTLLAVVSTIFIPVSISIGLWLLRRRPEQSEGRP